MATSRLIIAPGMLVNYYEHLTYKRHVQKYVSHDVVTICNPRIYLFFLVHISPT